MLNVKDIHTCPKMKYKGEYFPSELLAERSERWVPLTECIPSLESNLKFIDIDPNGPDAQVPEENLSSVSQSLPMWYRGHPIPFAHLTNSAKRQLLPVFMSYVQVLLLRCSQ